MPTRSGLPTLDDLDERPTLVWKKPAFFVALSKALGGWEATVPKGPTPPLDLARVSIPAADLTHAGAGTP